MVHSADVCFFAVATRSIRLLTYWNKVSIKPRRGAFIFASSGKCACIQCSAAKQWCSSFPASGSQRDKSPLMRAGSYPTPQAENSLPHQLTFMTKNNAFSANAYKPWRCRRSSAIHARWTNSCPDGAKDDFVTNVNDSDFSE